MSRAIISLRARPGRGEQLGRQLGELQRHMRDAVACLGCELWPEGEEGWLLRSHWSSEQALEAYLQSPQMLLLGQLVGCGLIRHMALRLQRHAPESPAA